MRLTQSPKSVRRAQLDNLALVPASLLLFRSEWQRLANQLPQGEVLMILPEAQSASRKSMESTAQKMRSKGQRVNMLTIKQLGLRPIQPV